MTAQPSQTSASAPLRSPRRRSRRSIRRRSSTRRCSRRPTGGASPRTRTSTTSSSSITAGSRRSRSRRPDKLLEALRGLVSEDFIRDATEGFARAPMSVRVSPYLLSLIDWNDPYRDPLRIQFIPLASRFLPDHPKLGLDSLHEREDAPVPGLTHRYTDKALFLPLDTCPVYCRFCTRSYAVGVDTEEVEKTHFKVDEERWQRAFAYIASRPELEDIVVSGGDAYNLRAEQIEAIGQTLLSMDNIRRIRLATKGPAVMPQKILTDHEWIDAVTRVVELGRKLHKEVVVHTHFNHPNEITGITQRRDAQALRARDHGAQPVGAACAASTTTPETMKLLVKRLGHLHVHPYYVYVHDLVKGAEDLRTTLATAMHDREARARLDGGVQHADVRRATPPAAAASATPTRSSTTIA